jgi:asparagine synthase (glutamine-hydrolysing)
MCGIFGILTPDLSEVNIQEFTDRMIHRGPDDSGIYTGKGIALSVRRLSIIDLVGGHQPISNEDGQLWLVCNGEIVNAPELRQNLEAAGHTFKTRTDIETVLHGYEQWGENIIPRLRGMFAFALWDGRNRKLLLARDRFGIKPLYYARLGERLAFASEILPILEAIPNLPRQADRIALWRLFEVGFIPSPLTAFEGILKLPAAHLLVIEDLATRLECYWKPKFTPLGENLSIGAPQAADAFIEHVRDAITAWRLSDVPVGSLLSGGIDSSALAALLTEVNNSPISTFTLGFDAVSLDESALARQTANFIGSQHHEMSFKLNDFQTLPEVVKRLEEPQCATTSLSLNAIYQGCHAAGFKVVMTGEGSDELLGGYAWYLGDQRLRPYFRISPAIRRLLAQSPLVKSSDIKNMLRFGNSDILQRYILWQRSPRPDQITRLLNTLAPKPLLEIWHEQYGNDLRGLHPVDQMLFIESRTRLVDYINFQMDRLSMSHSVEARPVFLDHLLWEFTCRLPPKLKLTQQENKYLLRLGMQNRLPEQVVRRRKKGLSSPVTSWWRASKLPEWAEDLLQPRALNETGYFRPSEVTYLLQAHRSTQVNLSHLLTGILTTQIWHNLFIKSSYRNTTQNMRPLG